MKINKEIKDIIFRTAIVIISNIILSLGTVWFLEPAHLYAGGVTGLAQFIQRLIIKFGGNINLGILVFLINIPIVIIGIKYVSKKFAIYSMLAIAVQALVTGLLPNSPFESLAYDITYINEFGQITTANYGGVLTLAIFGGLFGGIGAGIALKYGTSTGGIDIVAQAVSIHKDKSVGNVTMTTNVIIAFLGGALYGSWNIVLFTCVRIIINSIVMDKVHTAYTYTGITIISKEYENISNEILMNMKRGCTRVNIQGAYSKNNYVELYCVVSTYEIDKVLRMVDKYDPNAFVTTAPVKRVKGNFKKKSIV